MEPLRPSRGRNATRRVPQGRPAFRYPDDYRGLPEHDESEYATEGECYGCKNDRQAVGRAVRFLVFVLMDVIEVLHFLQAVAQPWAVFPVLLAQLSAATLPPREQGDDDHRTGGHDHAEGVGGPGIGQ